MEGTAGGKKCMVGNAEMKGSPKTQTVSASNGLLGKKDPIHRVPPGTANCRETVNKDSSAQYLARHKQ